VPLCVCTTCETPHHPECWEFGGGCAIFACGESNSRRIAAELFEASRPAPFCIEDAGDSSRPERPIIESPGSSRSRLRRESQAVAVLSWLYMAVSLALAIPATGMAMGGLAKGSGTMLWSSVLLAGAAHLVKTVGDLIAVGDPRGRTAHIGLCLLAAVAAIDVVSPLVLVILVAPVHGSTGLAHFGIDENGD
jgi:hypothetical protein